MRVLLVEDDLELAEYVRKGLEEEGYVVQVSFDGAAGLKAAELTAFDIIVRRNAPISGRLGSSQASPIPERSYITSTRFLTEPE